MAHGGAGGGRDTGLTIGSVSELSGLCTISIFQAVGKSRGSEASRGNRIADLHVIIDTGSLVACTRNHNQAFARHAGRSLGALLRPICETYAHHTSTYIRAYTIIVDDI
jgi:hypothetical protein